MNATVLARPAPVGPKPSGPVRPAPSRPVSPQPQPVVPRPSRLSRAGLPASGLVRLPARYGPVDGALDGVAPTALASQPAPSALLTRAGQVIPGRSGALFGYRLVDRSRSVDGRREGAALPRRWRPSLVGLVGEHQAHEVTPGLAVGVMGWECPACGLPDPYHGDGDGIGSCQCPRCEYCGGPPLTCSCESDVEYYGPDATAAGGA